MKLVYRYMAIFFFNFQTTSNHLYALQVENCERNSRLVVDEDYNGKFRLERVRGSNRVDIEILHVVWYLTTKVHYLKAMII